METGSLSGQFAERVRAYFAKALGAEDLRVEDASQIFGGISRQTWRVELAWEVDAGTTTRRSLILRLDPPSSLLESGRRVEYAMYKAFWGRPDVRVPEPILIEDDPEPLGMPFFAVSRVEGVAHQSAFLQPPFREAGPLIARETFEILGAIAATDYRGLDLGSVLPTAPPEKVWCTELDRWEKSFRDHALGPMPITEAAIRKLRREPPPPPLSLSVVHGDYHFGNWMYSPQGVVAVLDWEMAHLGDPHEDLAWALLPCWRSGAQPGRIMHYLEPEEAISIWELSRGLTADPAALRWWTLFSYVKSNALWVKAAHEFGTDPEAPLTYALVGWVEVHRQEALMLEEMGVAKP